ncbi:MAG: CapA family protein [Proteobacteria bacterium]|nr:CapA family protein [Pseudomonadota bacterium]
MYISTSSSIKLFLTGDVMLGRGIDQVLPYPNEPTLYESYIKNAKDYVKLAESVNGKINKPVSFDYIWGDALLEFNQIKPDVKIINLETSITKSSDYWKNKGINYRMHPKNVEVLTAANIDCCSLANNHVLDWGYEGLIETIHTLKHTNINFVGAGLNLEQAQQPVIFDLGAKGRVIIFGYGFVNSGIPLSWSVTESKAGVNLLKDYSDKTVQFIHNQVKEHKKPNDIIVISLHSGGNWGYELSSEEINFVHKLIDVVGVDIIHGHSSHHAKAIELYHDKLILYGLGDFINDYEGIGGYEAFRANLPLMYFIEFKPNSNQILDMFMAPMEIKNFKLCKASTEDALWLLNIFNQEGKRFNTSFEIDSNGYIRLQLS